MHGVCIVCVWYIHGVCMVYIWYMPGVCCMVYQLWRSNLFISALLTMTKEVSTCYYNIILYSDFLAITLTMALFFFNSVLTVFTRHDFLIGA